MNIRTLEIVVSKMLDWIPLKLLLNICLLHEKEYDRTKIQSLLVGVQKNVSHAYAKRILINHSLYPYFLKRIRNKTEEMYGFRLGMVEISLCRNCNLNCKGCWVPKSGEGMLHDQEVQGIIKQAKELGCTRFVLLGGEPLLVDYIPNVLRNHRECLFAIYTNGLLINEELVRTIKETKNVYVMISNEANCYFTQERRGEIFSRIQESIDLLRRNRALFGISITYNKDNIHELLSQATYDYWRNLGVCMINLLPYRPVTSDPEDFSRAPSAKEKQELVDYLRRNQPKDMYISLGSIVTDGLASPCCNAAGYRGIQSGDGILHIDYNGNIEPCVCAKHYQHNIRRTTLLKALQSEFFQAFRKNVSQHEGRQFPCALDNFTSYDHLIAENQNVRVSEDQYQKQVYGSDSFRTFLFDKEKEHSEVEKS